MKVVSDRWRTCTFAAHARKPASEGGELISHGESRQPVSLPRTKCRPRKGQKNARQPLVRSKSFQTRRSVPSWSNPRGFTAHRSTLPDARAAHHRHRQGPLMAQPQRTARAKTSPEKLPAPHSTPHIARFALSHPQMSPPDLALFPTDPNRRLPSKCGQAKVAFNFWVCDAVSAAS